MSGPGVKPTFGGNGMDDPIAPTAALDDPSYGADQTLTAQPAAPAQVQPRSPMMGVMPAQPDAINDDDLMTDEEAAAAMAKLLGTSTTAMGADYNHNENLAAVMETNWLHSLGQDLLEKIRADIESRKPWEQRFARGLQIIGLEDFAWGKDAGPFEGASNAVHPMLAQAIVQSQARFMEEIFPAAGPVKTMVMGEETPEKRDSADRVEDHMNYQLTVEDETYFMESQKLGLYLPIYGTAYRKAYHDFVEDRNVLRFIAGADMILPYSARNLKESPRKTHRFKIGQDEYDRAVAAGAYIHCELGEPPMSQPDAAEQKLDKLDDKTPVEAPRDAQWTFYETDLRLDLPGHEDTNDQGGDTGIALPYTVTLERDTGNVVAIRRCWKQSDHLKLPRTRYAEYWYLPGLGSMGTGLIHWIGTIAESGTDALRALLDSATWANLQGGFKAKDAGTKAGEIRMKPGTWLDVDMTADELAKAFHTPPVREPSEALFKLLGFLTDQAQRFASTSDMMVGEQDAKGAPVGTTIALIEQGSKVYSGVHKRAHFAAGIEFRMLAELNAEYIPPEGYPYQVPGDDLQVFQADYDPTVVSVVPVSDPNIYSQTQRIALGQTRYQMWKENPSYFRGYQVLKSLFKAFKDPEMDDTMVDPDEVPVMDPVSENIAMATARPVKAKDGENHDAHLVVHMAFAQHPQFGGLPQAQQLLGPAMMAHVAEHVALKYADTMRKLGAPVPPINLSAPNGTPIEGEQQQAQTDAIAVLAAQMTGAFMQQSGLTTTQPAQQNQAATDDHLESEARRWSLITAGLASLAKAGSTVKDAMAVEQLVDQGDGTMGPAPAGGGPAPVGALGKGGPAPAPALPHPTRPPGPPHPASPPAAAPMHNEAVDGPPAPASLIKPAPL